MSQAQKQREEINVLKEKKKKKERKKHLQKHYTQENR